MKNYLFLSVLICSSQLAAKPPDSLLIHSILKMMPLHLIDFDNSVTIAWEIPLKNTAYSIQTEFGYGRTDFNVWSDQRKHYPNKETWRGRLQGRYYFVQKPKRGTYLALEYFFKKNSIRKEISIGIDCVDGKCADYEKKVVPLGRFIHALNFKLGWQWQVSSKLSLDLYTGLGLRILSIGYLDGTIEKSRLPLFPYMTDIPGTYGPLLYCNLGLYVGYQL
jgi:hypothetical protein